MPMESPVFFLKFPGPGNFGAGKSWKLKCKILESPVLQLNQRAFYV